jgi:hypothetical protein
MTEGCVEADADTHPTAVQQEAFGHERPTNREMVYSISSIPPPTDVISGAAAATNENSLATTDSNTATQASSDSQGSALQATNDIRLIIEKAAHSPEYVYKLVNATTGDVIVELPREQVVKAAESPNYTSGSVVDTRA